jgi:hypothetical protein
VGAAGDGTATADAPSENIRDVLDTAAPKSLDLVIPGWSEGPDPESRAGLASEPVIGLRFA